VLFRLTLFAAAMPAAGQTTRPATASTAKLTADVWTCTEHGQFRMTMKGECPLCSADLVRKKISLAGGEGVIDPYPLNSCIVSGQPLGSMGTPIVMAQGKREVRLCCKGCIKKFEKNTAEYLKKIDARIVEQQLPYYPMTTCPISTEPLDAMGTPVNHVHNNRLVRFCCKGCLKAFRKDPAASLATLDEAVIAQQLEDYPLSTCLISRQKLGSMGEPINYVVANRLVRFCCGGCAGAFNKAPSVHLATLDEAREGTP
jgi:YHS domain-containing protein